MATKKTPAAPKATVAKAAPAPAPVTVTVVQGVHGGIPLAQLPANIAARGAGVGKATDAVLAIRVRAGSKACKVRAPHCVAWWASTEKVLAAGKGEATLGALAAENVPPHFSTYAVRRGWLAEAK